MDFAQLMFNTLAQAHGEEEAAAAVLSGAACCVVPVMVVVCLGIWVAICLFLSKCLQAVPPEFRKQEPGKVWLLFIPLFNLIWIFFVFPKIAESFKAYFDSAGRTDVGDCGRGLALAYCISIFIPCVNILSLILLIVVLVKFNGLKNQIQQA